MVEPFFCGSISGAEPTYRSNVAVLVPGDANNRHSSLRVLSDMRNAQNQDTVIARTFAHHAVKLFAGIPTASSDVLELALSVGDVHPKVGCNLVSGNTPARDSLPSEQLARFYLFLKCDAYYIPM